MRELAILSFVSLDGVMQAPKLQDEDLSGDFSHGGWANPYWDNVMENVAKVAMSQPYDTLFGRNTYDTFTPTFAGTETPLDRATKYVVTSRPIPAPWQPTVQLSGDILTAIRALKEQDGPLIQVHGSQTLIQFLLQHHLIDEYRIWTFPIILGGGKRLFDEPSTLTKLDTIQSEVLTSGVTMAVYRNKADP